MFFTMVSYYSNSWEMASDITHFQNSCYCYALMIQQQDRQFSNVWWFESKNKSLHFWWTILNGFIMIGIDVCYGNLASVGLTKQCDVSLWGQRWLMITRPTNRYVCVSIQTWWYNFRTMNNNVTKWQYIVGNWRRCTDLTIMCCYLYIIDVSWTDRL